MYQFLWASIIIKPTIITYHTTTLIDNILFNSLDFFTISGNIIYDLGDHLPNFLIINEITMLPDSKDKIYKQDFSNVLMKNLLWMTLHQSSGKMYLVNLRM